MLNDKSKKLYHNMMSFNIFLAIVSGSALFFAFPRPALYPFAWIGLVPLLIAVRRARPVGSFFLGLLAGFVFFAGLLYWINLFGHLPWTLLSLMQGVFIAVFALFANFIYRRGRISIIIIPAMWTAIEWVRSLGSFGFTWGDLAYSQVKWLPIVQIASIAGPWAVTFLIVFVNAAIAEFFVRDNKRYKAWAVVATIAVIITAVWGNAEIGRISQKTAPELSVAMVQGNVELTWNTPEIDKKIYETYWPMTEGLKGKADFIVWPESSLPDDIESSTVFHDEISRLAKDSGAYLLAGGLHNVPDNKAAGGYRQYNGAYLFSPSGKMVGKYYKIQLVPFGEFVPGRNSLPFLDKYQINEFDRYPGPGFSPIKSDKGNIGVMICFESTFPHIGRQFSSNGADILFIITNDSWFKKTSAAAQHHDFSILRAIENRRYVVRNASTGISSLIAPTGQIIANAGLGKKSIVSGKVEMMHGQTFYAKHGDWFAHLCTVLAFVGIFTAIVIPSKMKGRQS